MRLPVMGTRFYIKQTSHDEVLFPFFIAYVVYK